MWEAPGASGGGSVHQRSGFGPGSSGPRGGCCHQELSPWRLPPRRGGSAAVCPSGQPAALSRCHVGMSPSVFTVTFAARHHPERCWQLPAPLGTSPRGLGWTSEQILCARGRVLSTWSWALPSPGVRIGFGRCARVGAGGLAVLQGRCDGSSGSPALSEGLSVSAGTPQARLSMGTSWWPSSRRRGRWRGPAARSHTARRR